MCVQAAPCDVLCSPSVLPSERQSCMSEVSLGILDLDNMQGEQQTTHNTGVPSHAVSVCQLSGVYSDLVPSLSLASFRGIHV